MMTNRCCWFGGVHETVPRHECSTEWCEFSEPDKIQVEIKFWKDFERRERVSMAEVIAQEHAKLEFAKKRGKGLDSQSNPSL